MIIGAFLFNVVPMFLLGAVIYAVYALIRKGRKMPLAYHIPRYVFLSYILSLISLTIFWGGISFGNAYHMLNLQPFVWLSQTYDMGHRRMVIQLLCNIGMFIPFGLLCPVVFKRTRVWWKTVLTAFGTSFLIEFIQYFIGRSCDIDDLIMNTLGACIGYAAFIVCSKAISKKASPHKTGGEA